MNLSIRKYREQQVELTAHGFDISTLSLIPPRLRLLPLSLVLYFVSTFAHADIYRFVTVDGVETFTDAPSDKSATVIIQDQPPSASKKRTKLIVGGTITSKVGMRIDPIDGTWRHHNGVDIAIPTGTPVNAVAAGVVVYSGMRSGYGNTVVVEHDNGILTLYAHNSRIMAVEGQQVSAESTLALSGSTGRSTGPHLHFEAWQAGTNITSAFLPDSGVTLTELPRVASSYRAARFRSETLSDGSILFTNLPAATP